MANGVNPNSAMTQNLTPGPRPAPAATPAAPDSVQSKRDLTSWWRTFKRGNPSRPEDKTIPQGIFGVPLQTSIRYANVAISLFNDEGQSYIYGYVPIVVAKCGVFLKEKATDVEGIFRLSGSEKRIKELKLAFDSPDRYGKGLDWSGYTVHDAANILRRYFNQLPEPIIPLDFYERFRDPLRNHQAQAVGSMDLQGPEIGTFDHAQVISVYQALITELPPLNRQLLLYILDLLAVFASKADLNKMTTPNLAAIFQPGLLSHPQHDMAPAEYRLSQDVLIFLIENQDSFLIGMHGTAVDEKTVQEVQSGVPSPSPSNPSTPGRSNKLLGRSNSNASAGADSVRRFGNLRRNVSVSSKTSKHSAVATTPVTPTNLGSPSTGGLYRSNTVPSKRSIGASPRFQREKSSGPSTPSPGLPSPVETVNTAVRTDFLEEEEAPTPTARTPPLGFVHVPTTEILSASSSEATTPLAAPGSDTSSAGLIPKDGQALQREQLAVLAPPPPINREVSAERSASGTPSRAFLDIFKASPTAGEGEKKDGRKRNKLQKKNIPGSALSSAQSSAASLQHDAEIGDEYSLNRPLTPNFEAPTPEYLYDQQESAYATAQSSPRHATPTRTQTDLTLRPTVSPTHSYASATDASDADHTDTTSASVERLERPERRSRWRFSHSASRTKDREAAEQTTPTPTNIGSLSRAEQQSKSTIGSTSASGARSRRSFQEPPASSTGFSDPEAVLSDNEGERKKGPMSWIRGKIAERKERNNSDAAAEREKHLRARSPEKLGVVSNPSRQSLALVGIEKQRGKSFEAPRQESMASVRDEAETNKITPAPVPAPAPVPLEERTPLPVSNLAGTGSVPVPVFGQGTAIGIVVEGSNKEEPLR